LEEDRDARPEGRRVAAPLDRRAAEQDAPGSRRMKARKQSDQRGLAGAVRPEDEMALARAELGGYIAEDLARRVMGGCPRHGGRNRIQPDHVGDRAPSRRWARTSSMISMSGLPVAWAMRLRSSYSGTLRSSPEGSAIVLTRTRPRGVSTSRIDRLRSIRPSRLTRTPIVEDSAKSRSTTAGARRGSQRAVTSTPGRPFFICTGVRKTSAAPLSKRASVRWP